MCIKTFLNHKILEFLNEGVSCSWSWGPENEVSAGTVPLSKALPPDLSTFVADELSEDPDERDEDELSLTENPDWSEDDVLALSCFAEWLAD